MSTEWYLVCHEHEEYTLAYWRQALGIGPPTRDVSWFLHRHQGCSLTCVPEDCSTGGPSDYAVSNYTEIERPQDQNDGSFPEIIGPYEEGCTMPGWSEDSVKHAARVLLSEYSKDYPDVLMDVARTLRQRAEEESCEP